MNRESKIVKLKLDIIFKRVFGDVKNEKIIIAFISDLLEIPRSSIQEIYIENVELAPEYLDEKFSRLDLKMKVDEKIINIEMQVNKEPDFKERTLYYWSKIYSGELKTGDEYAELNQTVCINIINFNQFDCKEYHSHFKVLERFDGYTLLEVNIETGRTHQIRVHLAQIGYPIVGDSVYSNGKNPFGVEGQMLHSYKLKFKHPISGKDMELEAPLPKYFIEVLDNIRP